MSTRGDDPSVSEENTMNYASDNSSGNQARILLFSQRNIYSNTHFRLGLYEFEDIISQVDSIDFVAPQRKNWFKYGTRIANRLASYHNASINPGVSKIKVHKDYDIFFAVVNFPRDLLHIKYFEGWKDRCKTSICWLNEIWIRDISRTKYYLRVLRDFDYVVLSLAGSVQRVQEAVNRPCVYMPHGIDAILFCPYPNPPRRVIDVYSIGRRPEETHRTLLEMGQENKIFYVYDVIDGEQVLNANEHRSLFANTAKRSRYFIVNPGKLDVPEETEGQIEFGSRFFEGASSGTIMIGEKPRNEKFEKVFDWEDAVIDLPFGSGDIDLTIHELDKQPERQEMIRKTNMVQSLLHHDWVYRWEEILKIAGLEPLRGLVKRKERLRTLARMVEKDMAIYHSKEM
jgi:hypothetical protein